METPARSRAPAYTTRPALQDMHVARSFDSLRRLDTRRWNGIGKYSQRPTAKTASRLPSSQTGVEAELYLLVFENHVLLWWPGKRKRPRRPDQAKSDAAFTVQKNVSAR